MASSCSHFNGNIWRPHICVNCYKPKSKHKRSEVKITPQIKNLETTSNRILYDQLESERYKTMSTSQALNGKSTVYGQRSPLIGVVKPYAVVDIDTDTDDKGEIFQRRYSEPNIQVHKTAVINADTSKQFKESHNAKFLVLDDKPAMVDTNLRRQKQLESVESLEPRNTNSTTTIKCFQSKSKIPKRKAPLPPPRMLSSSGTQNSIRDTKTVSESIDNKPMKLPSPHPLRRNDAGAETSVYTFQTRVELRVLSRPRATTIAGSDRSVIHRENNEKKRKVPPEKPPRTLSTFISIDEQDELVQQLHNTNMEENQEIELESQQQPEHCYAEPITIATMHPLCPFTGVTSLESGSSTTPVLKPSSKSQCSSSLNSNGATATLSDPIVVTTYSQVMQLISNALSRIYLTGVEYLLCKEDLWQISWDDVNVLSRETVSYKGIQLYVKVSIMVYWYKV